MKYFKIDDKKILKIDDNNRRTKIIFNINPFEIIEINELYNEPWKIVKKEEKISQIYNISLLEELSKQQAINMIKKSIKDELNRKVAFI